MPQSQVGFFDVIQKNNRATEFFRLPSKIIPAANFQKFQTIENRAFCGKKLCLLFFS